MYSPACIAPDAPAQRAARRRGALAAACLLAALPAAGLAVDVGDAGAGATAAASATAPDAATSRDAAQQTFLRLVDEKRYEEAVAIARQIVDLTRRMHGDGSLELATPLTNLGTAQMELGDLAAADASYRAAVAIIERRDGVASPRLVNPLMGLGETCARQGLYAQAAEAYQRALHANHAEAGFYNLEQVPILDGLSESYLGLDRIPQANAQQRAQIAIQRRHAPADGQAVAQAWQKLARWYGRTGQFQESHAAYQEARRVIRDGGGDNDPAMVDTQLGEALAYRDEGAIPYAVTALKRALDLVDAQPKVDHRKRAEVLVAMADLYIVARQPRAARQRYGEAWQELSGDDALREDRDRYFAQPTRISGPRLPDVVDGAGKARTGTAAAQGGYERGLVLAGLTVTTDGRADATRILESTPPGLLDKQLLRALDGTAFRPAVADGEPVERANVQFRHEFRYARPPPRSEAEPGDLPQPGAGEKGGPISYPAAGDGDHGGS